MIKLEIGDLTSGYSREANHKMKNISEKMGMIFETWHEYCAFKKETT